MRTVNQCLNAILGGAGGGKYIISAKGAISAAHVAAVGAGYTPGVQILTVVQAGASGGMVSTTCTAGGELPAIGTAVTVLTGGVLYSVADTLATTGGGGAGGQVHVTAITMAEYDFIIASAGVAFTELKDSVGMDLLAAKALTGITIAGNDKIFASGTGKKIRNMTYTGGNVFGFNYDDTSV